MAQDVTKTEEYTKIEAQYKKDVELVREEWVALCKSYEVLGTQLVRTGIRLNNLLFKE